MAEKIKIGGELDPRTPEKILGDASTIKDRAWETRHGDVTQTPNQKQDEINEYLQNRIDNIVANAADEEDITSVNVGGTDVLKFKDKAYSPLTYSGLGRVYLRKNIVNGVNTLTQDMFYKEEAGFMVPNTNTIFVIQYDYDLNDPNGENPIIIPANCVLEFDGGSLKNGVLKAVDTNTTFISNLLNNRIFNNVVPIGFNLPNLDIRWFGAIPDANLKTYTGTDNTEFIQQAINIQNSYYKDTSLFVCGRYYIGGTIEVGCSLTIKGVSNPTFGFSGEPESSKSCFILAHNITAFNVTGENYYGSKIASINIEGIGVFEKYSVNQTVGFSSTFINLTASGAPSRSSHISFCDVRGLKYFIHAHTLENNRETLIGCMVIDKCNIQYCDKAICSNDTIGGTFTNLAIRDNNITLCNKNCLELYKVYGNIIIENNILEENNEPIYIESRASNVYVAIRMNYFELPSGTYYNNIKLINNRSEINSGAEWHYENYKAEIIGNSYTRSVECTGVTFYALDLFSSYNKFENCIFRIANPENIFANTLFGFCLFSNYPTTVYNAAAKMLTPNGANSAFIFDDELFKNNCNSGYTGSINISSDTNDYAITIVRLKVYYPSQSYLEQIKFNHTGYSGNYYYGIASYNLSDVTLFCRFLTADLSNVNTSIYCNEKTKISSYTGYKSDAKSISNFPRIALSQVGYTNSAPFAGSTNRYNVGTPLYVGSIKKPIWYAGFQDYREADSAQVGVKRSGLKSQRPTGGNIYIGFQYMQVDNTYGTFPIWASAISNDIVTWIKADGTNADADADT